jgi:hypothetical protein
MTDEAKIAMRMVVVFDVQSDKSLVPALVKLIKSTGTWARLADNVYLVVSTKTPAEVRDDLVRVLGEGDRLFVGMCPPPSAWRGLGEVAGKWIHAH